MVRTRTASKGDGTVVDSTLISKVPLTDNAASFKPSLRRSTRTKIFFHQITPSPSHGNKGEDDKCEANKGRETTRAARKLFGRKCNVQPPPREIEEKDDTKTSASVAASKRLFPKEDSEQSTLSPKQQRKRLMISTLDSLALVGTPTKKEFNQQVTSPDEDANQNLANNDKEREDSNEQTKKSKSHEKKQKIPYDLVRVLAPVAVPFSNIPQSATARSPMESCYEDSGVEDSVESTKKSIRPASLGPSPSKATLRPKGKLPHTPRGFSSFQENPLSISEPEPPAKKKWGRPPKAASITHSETIPETNVVAVVPPKKRRGRPPRTSTIVSETSVSAPEIPPKKKRGRPRKSAAAESTTDTTKMSGDLVVVATETRKRGSLPKKPAQSEAQDVAAPLKRKRGRPPKNSYKNQSTCKEAQAQGAAPPPPLDSTEEGIMPRPESSPKVAPAKKRRGRPPKRRIDDAQIVTSVIEQDDRERPYKRTRRSSPRASLLSDKNDVSSQASSENHSTLAEAGESPRMPTTILTITSSQENADAPPKRRRGRPRKDETRSALPRVTVRPSAFSRRAKLHQTFDLEEYSVLSTLGKNKVMAVSETKRSPSSSRGQVERHDDIPASPLRRHQLDGNQNRAPPTNARSPVRRHSIVTKGSSPVRRRIQIPVDKDFRTDSNVCQFDSTSKKLIIDTASVPEAVVNAITNQVQACLEKVRYNPDDTIGASNHFAANLRGTANDNIPAKTNDHPRYHATSHPHDVDARSITSELTSDFSKAASHVGMDAYARINQHSDGKHRKAVDEERTVPKPLSFGAQEADANGETKSFMSAHRRRVFWNCSDSLAGSVALSRKLTPFASNKEGKIPQEVSLKKPSPALQSNVGISLAASKPASLRERSRKDDEGEIPSAIPMCNPASAPMRCGKCAGCQRERDCQTCESCLNRLRRFGPMPPPIGKQEECLKRRCLKARRVGHADVLQGGNISKDGPHDKIATSATSKEDSRRNLGDGDGTSSSEEDESERNDLVPRKAPWEEGDDWTVDYSYLSETDYRRRLGRSHWKRSIHRQSSVSSQNSKRSWLFPFSRRRKQASVSRERRSSLSSVSTSKKSLPEKPTPPPLGSIKDGREREMGLKRQRDPLYNLGLLQPSKLSKGILPIDAWKDDSKSVQALLRYDESDQDWV
jgi:CXXC zinc finger domain